MDFDFRVFNPHDCDRCGKYLGKNRYGLCKKCKEQLKKEMEKERNEENGKSENRSE